MVKPMHEHKDAKKLRIGSITFALIAGLVILALKFYAARISNSSALRSDALESTVNVLAAAFGLGSILFSEKPADRDHPYGHGKIEYFASAFEGGLISLAGFLILIDTLGRWFSGAPIENLGHGLAINLFAGLLNGLVGMVIYISGKKHHSQVLIADGMHLLTDLATTIAITIGLGLTLLTQWHWLDPVIALGVSGFLFWTGFQLVREAAAALLDAENPKLLKRIVDHFNQLERGKIITLHELKARDFGRDKHIDVHLVIPEFLTVKEAHEITDAFVSSLMKEFGKGSLIHTHIDPCAHAFCSECRYENCPIRVVPFRELKPFTIESSVKRGIV